MKICPNCGEQSEDTFDSCWKCGMDYETGAPRTDRQDDESIDSDPAASDPSERYMAKFKEWEETVNQMKKNWITAFSILLVINVFLVVIFGAFSLGGILLFGIVAFVNRTSAKRAARLYKELGLTPALVKAARNGELGTKVAIPVFPNETKIQSKIHDST